MSIRVSAVLHDRHLCNHINFNIARMSVALVGELEHHHKLQISLCKTRPGDKELVCNFAVGGYNIVLKDIAKVVLDPKMCKDK